VLPNCACTGCCCGNTVRVSTEVGLPLVQSKPVLKLDLEIREHLSLSPRAIIGPGARSLEFLCWDPHAAREEDPTEVLHPRCCRLDVHKETVVALHARLVIDGKPVKEVCTFSTHACGRFLDGAALGLEPECPEPDHTEEIHAAK
jgi:hypothetical protein